MNHFAQPQLMQAPIQVRLHNFDADQFRPAFGESELNALLNSQRPRLVKFVSKHLRHDNSQTEDIVQQACLLAYRNWSNFRGESKPETWLFGIAFNLLRNYRSKNFQLSNQTVELDGECMDIPAETAEEPLECLMRKQSIEQLSEGLQKLPAKLSVVLRLVLLEGLSYQQAAEELELPIGTVRSRLSRARDALREILGMETEELT